jgi:hypothetical protein
MDLMVAVAVDDAMENSSVLLGNSIVRSWL